MKTILQNKHTRRNFLISIAFLFLLILIIKFFILTGFEVKALVKIGQNIEIEKSPYWLLLVSKLLDSLLVSLTVTISIGLFLFYIEIPEEEKKFEIIEPFKIGETLSKERNESSKWHFNGGMGRYTREVTLPQLSKISSNSNRHISINMSIIDPLNDELCEKYSKFRRSLKSSKTNKSTWSAIYVKQEVMATIIVVKVLQFNNPLLLIKLFLKNNYSTMRLDFGSKVGVITKEDPKEPAIVCKENSFLFRTYTEELLQTEKEHNELAKRLEKNYELDEINTEDIKEIISFIFSGLELQASDYTCILKIIKDGSSQYQ